MDNYDDIINLPHHVSPFAALTGYEDAIEDVNKNTT